MGSKWFHNLHRGGTPRALAKGIRARIFPGTHLMLSVVDLQPWSESPVHSHMNEQWGVCLEGKWVRIQGGREYRVKAGDFWQTPPHVPHGGRTLGARCRILDIFAPPREDYRKPPNREGRRRRQTSLLRYNRPGARVPPK
jgi:quercetin dioxygenase-like cupin family protein